MRKDPSLQVRHMQDLNLKAKGDHIEVFSLPCTLAFAPTLNLKGDLESARS